MEKVVLEHYPVPLELRNQVVNSRRPTDDLKDKLERQLTPINYKEKLQELLFIEEIQMEKDILQYDMHEVEMQKDFSYLFFPVNLLNLRMPSYITVNMTAITIGLFTNQRKRNHT